MGSRLLGGLGKEEALVPGPKGLAPLGCSDGEGWGLVTSPLCFSKSER